MGALKDNLFGDQPAPFAYPNGPGHRGIDTSARAAASIMPHVAPMQRKILDYIIRCGAHGATYDEIMAGCDLGAPSVCGRLVELRRAQPPLIRIASFTRPTASGRAAHVYIDANLVHL